MAVQLALPLTLPNCQAKPETPDLESYDRIIVAFSGGKDSLACLLYLFDLGVPAEKIELWHHDVDGHGPNFMDWPCTASYCRQIATALKLPIYFSWKEGGFWREMMRCEAPTSPTSFEMPWGNGKDTQTVGGSGKPGTRLKFPQPTSDLRTRWCSAYLKIDVMERGLVNQDRFRNSRTLILTGERAEESATRAKYATFCKHKNDARNGKSKRHIDQWRPVHDWDSVRVWDIISKYRINPHPAYKLGWGRVSCAACIFGSPNQWASLRQVNPVQFERIYQTELQLQHTIKQGVSIQQQADTGCVYAAISPDFIAEALNPNWNEPVFLEDWKMPWGAHGESTGPT